MFKIWGRVGTKQGAKVRIFWWTIIFNPGKLEVCSDEKNIEGHALGALNNEWGGDLFFQSVQFSHSVVSLCSPIDCSTPGLPVHHQLLEIAQTHVHRVGDAIQPSHPLSSPSPPAFNLSQQQCLFKWVSSLHQVAKVLEFRLQHQSFQWTLRTDLL